MCNYRRELFVNLVKRVLKGFSSKALSLCRKWVNSPFPGSHGALGSTQIQTPAHLSLDFARPPQEVMNWTASGARPVLLMSVTAKAAHWV